MKSEDSLSFYKLLTMLEMLKRKIEELKNKCTKKISLKHFKDDPEAHLKEAKRHLKIYLRRI